MGVGSEHQELIDLLSELMDHPGVQRLKLQIDFTDARSVGWRLAELLPIDAEIKQSLLQLQLPRERLQELTRLGTREAARPAAFRAVPGSRACIIPAPCNPGRHDEQRRTDRQ